MFCYFMLCYICTSHYVLYGIVLFLNTWLFDTEFIKVISWFNHYFFVNISCQYKTFQYKINMVQHHTNWIQKNALTLKAPNKNCSRQHFNFFTFVFRKKIRLDFSCERIHLKHQVLFSLKNNEQIYMNVCCCSRDWRFNG